MTVVFHTEWKRNVVTNSREQLKGMYKVKKEGRELKITHLKFNVLLPLQTKL